MHVTAITCVSKMTTKKRVILSLNDKVKVIRLHKKGNSSRKLAAQFNVGENADKQHHRGRGESHRRVGRWRQRTTEIGGR